ncbi:MAG: M1 family aminopeptidase [Planctomyces sp.]|nr:hypothetical protein [Planctomyces sp.]
MFKAVFLFELRFWLRSRLLYSLLLTTTAIMFLSMATEIIRFRAADGGQIRNSPYTIQFCYQFITSFGFLIFASFPIAAASRDHTYQMSEIIFTTSVSRLSWLLGRFAAAGFTALIPLGGISIGILSGSIMPWNDPSQFVAISWPAHLLGLTAIAVPNVLFIATIAFVISLRVPKDVFVYITLATLWFSIDLGSDLLRHHDHTFLAAMLDPFGSVAVSHQTRYWTAAEYRADYFTLTGYLLWNRLFWSLFSAVILTLGCRRFRFTLRSSRLSTTTVGSSPAYDLIPAARTDTAVPVFPSRTRQFLKLTAFEFRSAVCGPLFIILSGFVLQTLAFPLFQHEPGYGQQSLPVTSAIVTVIGDRCRFPALTFIIVAAGMLVHRERDCRIHEIISTLPHPDWLFGCGRLLAMTLAVAAMLTTAAIMGVASQLVRGFTQLQPEVYIVSLLGVELLQCFVLAVLIFTIQIFTPGKVHGYLLAFSIQMISTYISERLANRSGVISILHQQYPIYSDFYGFAPYASGMIAFSTWSLLLCAVLCLLISLLWQRGNDTGLLARLREARLRLRGRTAVAAAVICGTTLTYGVWLHTTVSNYWDPNNLPADTAANYETRFRTRFENSPQPRITDLRYEVDLYPQQRSVRIRSSQTLQNKDTAPQADILVNLPAGLQHSVRIEQANLLLDLPALRAQVWRIEPPLLPGDSIRMDCTSSYEAPALELQLEFRNLVQNGLTLTDFSPNIGYQPDRELQDEQERRKRGLPEPRPLPSLNPKSLTDRKNHRSSADSDLVTMETVVSTESDQVAIAPGRLLRSWKQQNRQYFHYRLDPPTLKAPMVLSARLKVARDVCDGITTEVWYHPEHEWNVPSMMHGLHSALRYGIQNFGPYQFDFARVVEFPRYYDWLAAVAFPGTMPYSESGGFITDIRSPGAFEKAFFIVAHEVAHQWWAYQVIGADMEGSKLLSETLAEYTAMMVMEREFGPEMVRRHLAVALQSYLAGRGRETRAEHPLSRVRPDQNYLSYYKGSLVMYHLRHLIGEEKINVALRRLLKKFAGKGPPYPVSTDLIDELKAETPAEYHAILDDLFNHIILFSNKITSCSIRQLAPGRQQLTLQIECRKLESDEKGTERDVPFEQAIEIGAFTAAGDHRKYGEALYRKMHQLKSGTNTVVFETAEIPDNVAVDPFFMLIDRNIADNVITPGVDR